jgi:integrase
MRDFWDLQASFHHYETNLFISDTKGQPYKHATLETYLRENALRILGRSVHPHMLRHTHVSLLIEAAELEGRDIKLKEIAARIGHGADSKITERIYFHKTKKLQEARNEKMRTVRLL